MDLEQQVCNLTLAKRLKELNVTQQSLFYWNEDDQIIFSHNTFHENSVTLREYYAALTVAELFELLPAVIDIKKEEPFNIYWLHLMKRSSKNIQYIVNYRCDTFQPPEIIQRILIPHNIYDENLANCLAKMLIYLIEEGFVKNV